MDLTILYATLGLDIYALHKVTEPMRLEKTSESNL